MGAVLGDLMLGDYCDLVSLGRPGKVVGNSDDGSVGVSEPQGFDDSRFGFRGEVGSCFVEDQDWTISNDCSGNGNELALTG